jgi:hypothetical protein
VRCTMGAFAVLAFSLLMVNIASAYGYGTSSISLGTYSASVVAGAGTSTSYTVNLASGSTWGTTLSVVNNNQLASQGIMVSLSNPSGDPPYSGTMTISTSNTTAPGAYNITLAATGDDPSSSSTNFVLAVSAPTSTPTTQTTTAPSVNNATTAQTTSMQQTTTISQPTTTVNYSSTGAYYSSGNSTAQLAPSALIILLILGAIYGLFTWKTTAARLAVIGTALILIGTVAWLYGDYAGGLSAYIWGGFAAILIGTAAWTYGDAKGGTFKQSIGKLVWLSIILILIGAFGWAYGELYAPGMPVYWWGGAALLVIGTFVWVYGDAKAGAFLRRNK